MWRVDTVTTGLGGDPFYTRFYFSDSAGAASEAVDTVLAFWDGLDSVIDNALTMTVDGIVTVVNPATGQITGTVSTASGGAVVGADAGLQTPQATQGLIQWRTGAYVNGREVRGRTFVPGVTQSRVLAGQPDTTYRSVLQAAADILFITGPTLQIWSPTNLVARDVTAAVPWTEFAVLRSRRT